MDSINDFLFFLKDYDMTFIIIIMFFKRVVFKTEKKA